MKMKTTNTFTTSDLSLATTLSMYFPIKFIDKADTNRVEFGFDNTSELNKLIEAFWKNELTVEPKHFFNQLRTVKARIYDKR